MNKKYNFSVDLHSKLSKNKSVEECNMILIKRFQKKWKRSGILRELKDRKQPMTRGQKERQKRWSGKRRQNKKG